MRWFLVTWGMTCHKKINNFGCIIIENEHDRRKCDNKTNFSIIMSSTYNIALDLMCRHFLLQSSSDKFTALFIWCHIYNIYMFSFHCYKEKSQHTVRCRAFQFNVYTFVIITLRSTLVICVNLISQKDETERTFGRNYVLFSSYIHI